MRKPDYAKWMPEDPRVNFAISARGRGAGIDHLGIQAETDAESSEIRDRLSAAERPLTDQGEVTCSYARSRKSWISDPQGVAWEAFLTHGSSEEYGEDTISKTAPGEAACCEQSSGPSTACCA